MVLVRRGDDSERVAGAPLRQADRGRLGERPAQQRVDGGDAGAGERDRAGGAAAADGAACAGRVADERGLRLAALRAARDVREVAREPQQLELEGERERLVRRAGGGRLRVVEQVEEARQRGERARVPLLLAEEAEHRLRADEARAEPVRVLARRVVRADQLDARDRLELAASLVEHELDVRQRLQARAEARRRLADPLGDGADPAALERVEVQDAVGLAEPERPEHDRLGLVRPAGHGRSSLVPGVTGTVPAVSPL